VSGKTTRRAARSLGGIAMQPPITRERAGKDIGAEITPEAWSAICRAFEQYGFALDNLAASRASKSKDPAKASWHERQKSTVKALEAALDRLEATRKHDEFLHEASENYALANLGYSAGSEVNADRMLREAYRKVLDALVIIERAEPMEIEVPTEATARAVLVRDIRDALQRQGIEARASTGFALDIPDRGPRLSDLTPFEQLLDALGIGDKMTVGAFSAFVRSALSGKKGGQVSPICLP
jgi:hypothetical protein